jgi:hypothetical protein
MEPDYKGGRDIDFKSHQRKGSRNISMCLYGVDGYE